MAIKGISVFAAALCLWGAASSAALASTTLTEPSSPSPSGAVSVTEIDADEGIWAITKRFTAVGNVPFNIHRDPIEGPDLLHISETVTNVSGVAWTDFHFFMTPLDANPTTTVTFSNVQLVTGGFTTAQPVLNGLSLFGSVPDNGQFQIAFDIQINAQGPSFDLLAINEIPSVPTPEPATMLLLGGSLLGLAFARPARAGRGEE